MKKAALALAILMMTPQNVSAHMRNTNNATVCVRNNAQRCSETKGESHGPVKAKTKKSKKSKTAEKSKKAKTAKKAGKSGKSTVKAARRTEPLRPRL